MESAFSESMVNAFELSRIALSPTMKVFESLLGSGSKLFNTALYEAGDATSLKTSCALFRSVFRSRCQLKAPHVIAFSPRKAMPITNASGAVNDMSTEPEIRRSCH